MGTLFHAVETRIKPAPGTRILRASDYAVLLASNELLAKARIKAEEIEKKAAEVYEERKKKGYEDGLVEGQLEQSEKMLETGLQAVEYLEGLERQIVDVVTTAVRKIIGELDDKERIVRIVRTALEQVRGRQRVLVRISPREEEYVREELAPMLKGSSSVLELVPDQRVKEGGCILESEMGVMDAGLDTQLKAIEQAFSARIGESERTA